MAQCFYCPADATLLCDGMLGWRQVWSREDGRYIIDSDRDDGGMVTCDRPLCVAHAVVRQPWFFHWSTPAGRRRGEMETDDWCPDCAAKAKVRTTTPPLVDDETANALPRRRLLRIHPEQGR